MSPCTWRCSTAQPQGRTRGDFLGGIFYGSNWYQIFVGQGYTANEAFVPVAPPVVAGGGGAVLPDLAAGDGRHPARSAATGCRGSRCGCSASAPGSSFMVGVAVRQRRRRHDVRARGDERLLEAVRSLHQRQRGAVPRHVQPRRRADARRGVRDGLAADGADARRGSRQGSPARPARRARPRRARAADVEAHAVGRRPLDRHSLRPVAVPRRVLPHRPGDADGDRRRHPPAGADGPAARQPGVQLGRHAQLRPVPLPLADLPDHPRARRRGDDASAVVVGDGASRCRSPRPAIATSRRRSARAGSANGCAAIVARAPPRRTSDVNGSPASASPAPRWSGSPASASRWPTTSVSARSSATARQAVPSTRHVPDRRPRGGTRSPSTTVDSGRPDPGSRRVRRRPDDPTVDRTADDRADRQALLRCRRVGDARRQAGARRPRHHHGRRGVEGSRLGARSSCNWRRRSIASRTASSSNWAPTAR